MRHAVALLALAVAGCDMAHADGKRPRRDAGAAEARDLAPSSPPGKVRRELALDWFLNELRIAQITTARDQYQRALDQLQTKKAGLLKQLKDEAQTDPGVGDTIDPDTFDIHRH